MKEKISKKVCMVESSRPGVYIESSRPVYIASNK